VAAPVVRFELKVNGEDLKMEGSRLRSLLYFQSIRGSAQYWINCTDRKWDYYDSLYEEDAELQMRIGIQFGNKELWSDVQNLAVGNVEASYPSDAVNVTISGMDQGEKLFRTCSRKVWCKDCGELVSSMVQELAEENGLSTQIEATKDRFQLTQGVIPDGHYIQKTLLPLAYNESRQDYLCYIKNGNILVFEPPDVGSVQATLKYPGAEDDYAPIEPPVVHYRPINLPPNGSWSTEMRSVNPNKKEATFFTADDGTVDLKKYATQLPTPPEQPARIGYTVYSQQDILENVTKAFWGNRSRELWIVDAKTVLSPKLELGKAVRLEMTDQDGESHFSSGKYMLAGLLHWVDIEMSRSMSRLWLARRSK
jgi:hypothetical protein